MGGCVTYGLLNAGELAPHGAEAQFHQAAVHRLSLLPVNPTLNRFSGSTTTWWLFTEREEEEKRVRVQGGDAEKEQTCERTEFYRIQCVPT